MLVVVEIRGLDLCVEGHIKKRDWAVKGEWRPRLGGSLGRRGFRLHYLSAFQNMPGLAVGGDGSTNPAPLLKAYRAA